MKTHTIQISLAELQQALREYCLQRGHDPMTVTVSSYDKNVIVVELEPNGLVSTEAIAHRA